ncbi:MAG: hypothetical protein JNL58_23080 [Planctomyces sp.]|nr:hypothetical protein [Planctomyces sp.]
MSHSFGESMPVDACRLLSRLITSSVASAALLYAGIPCPSLMAQDPAADEAGQASGDATPPGDQATGGEAAPPDAATPSTEKPGDQAPPGVDFVGPMLKQQEMARQIRDLKKPLLDPKEAEQNFNRNVSRDYRTLMSNGGNLTNAKDLETLKKGLEFRILRITLPDQKPVSVLNELRRDLNGAGSLITNTQNKQRFREAVCREAMVFLKQLLENNLEARSFAIAVMPDLEVVSATFQQKRIEVYGEVPDVLISILADPQQPDAVKVRAAAEIGRLMKKTDVVPLTQLAFAKALINQLGRAEAERAYQQQLIEVLCLVNQPREQVGTPVPSVIQALVNVMSDRSRVIPVRCLAARGLGKVAYDDKINFEPIAWKVTQLARESAEYFNNSPKNPVWQKCGWDLYLAFHHEVSPPGTQGMLNRNGSSRVVNEGYTMTLKVAVPMIGSGTAIPAEELQAVSDWLKTNQPANLQYDTNATPIVP